MKHYLLLLLGLALISQSNTCNAAAASASSAGSDVSREDETKRKTPVKMITHKELNLHHGPRINPEDEFFVSILGEPKVEEALDTEKGMARILFKMAKYAEGRIVGFETRVGLLGPRPEAWTAFGRVLSKSRLDNLRVSFDGAVEKTFQENFNSCAGLWCEARPKILRLELGGAPDLPVSWALPVMGLEILELQGLSSAHLDGLLDTIPASLKELSLGLSESDIELIRAIPVAHAKVNLNDSGLSEDGIKTRTDRIFDAFAANAALKFLEIMHPVHGTDIDVFRLLGSKDTGSVRIRVSQGGILPRIALEK